MHTVVCGSVCVCGGCAIIIGYLLMCQRLVTVSAAAITRGGGLGSSTANITASEPLNGAVNDGARGVSSNEGKVRTVRKPEKMDESRQLGVTPQGSQARCVREL